MAKYSLRRNSGKKVTKKQYKQNEKKRNKSNKNHKKSKNHKNHKKSKNHKILQKGGNEFGNWVGVPNPYDPTGFGWGHKSFMFKCPN